MSYSYTRMYIDGKWTEGTGRHGLPVINPATEEQIAEVPEGSVDDARAAIAAARRAFDEGPWSQTSPKERAAVLGRMADAIARRWDELIEVNIAEAGSSRPLARTLQIGEPHAPQPDYPTPLPYQYQF